MIESLISQGYVVEHKGKFKFTSAFYTEFAKDNSGIVLLADHRVAVRTPVAAEDWPTRYIKFIKEAAVPECGRSSNGARYDLNKYSEDGRKAFQKALETGTDYQVLVKSTMLYYKTTDMPVKIGNYIGQGTWRTGYDSMVEQLKDGTLFDNLAKIPEQDAGNFDIG